ncbi:MAG TPA: exonuclease domain-containing protein [Burkholderiaceae bacterium]|nr:exonuclease domain-containing protein [Burkholderiaceae bacterium]
MFAPRVAFVDLETTGASPARARVTEVGIVLVETGPEGERISEWASLVNPGCLIPADIQWLTGISNEMVRDAPPFERLAPEIAERLAGAVFVAHNARFDYGFLRAEFARAGIDFTARTLCTVRLSRHLQPDRGSHSLDALIERWNLPVADRHRALGDARITLRFVQRLYERLPRGEVEQAVSTLLKHPSTPAHLPADAIDALPRAPGVYLMYGLNQHPIYIGKSVDLRSRVAAHFAEDHRQPREQQLAQEVRRLEWEQTAGEFGALLREAELIKTRLPAHNLRLRRSAAATMLRIDEAGVAEFAAVAGADPSDLPGRYGPWSSRASARSALVARAREQGLCLRALGLERVRRGDAPDKPCFARQLMRCQGACVGAVSRAEHAAQVRAALADLQLAPWPHPGALALVERDAASGREDWHVFDAWCHLGSVRSPLAAAELLASAPRRFDADVQRLLRAALAPEPPWPLETVPL